MAAACGGGGGGGGGEVDDDEEALRDGADGLEEPGELEVAAGAWAWAWGAAEIRSRASGSLICRRGRGAKRAARSASVGSAVGVGGQHVCERAARWFLRG
jgi:hypothetical protein